MLFEENTTKPAPMYRGGSSAMPVYLGLGANITYKKNTILYKYK